MQRCGRTHLPRFARLLAAVVATLFVLSAKSAAAMSVVPMCGVNAETVIAPPISRTAPEIPLAPSSCEQKQDHKLETSAPRQAPLDQVSVELVPRVPPISFRLPREPRTRAPLLAVANGERSAHALALERPPR